MLNRVNFGEADRIITIMTADQGKLRLIAKGVRKEKSKLAGGIELFSISSITFIPGRNDIGTLVSSRLITHYHLIVQDIDRTMFGYELLKLMNKVTQEDHVADYYELLVKGLVSLNKAGVPLDLVRAWVFMRLLALQGHTPNLTKDPSGNRLVPKTLYQFDFDSMSFFQHENGAFTDRHIKLLRLLLSEPVDRLAHIADISASSGVCDKQLLGPLIKQYTHG